MENSFWHRSTDGNFVDWFKKSFILYVESGMKKQIEADIDILTNTRNGDPVTDNIKTQLEELITGHYLRKFHCLHSRLVRLTTCHYLNAARPEHQAAV
jgi:hypothetical protein